MADVDSTLAYIDQGSFLGLRALGRGPLAQYAWIYERQVDLDGLRRFHHNLGRGLLGRRIERSPLPFGRDHWVAWTGPADIDLAASARPRAEALDWLDEQIRVPIDPEAGPSWRLAVQPFIEGGAAVTLIASHSICDGLAITLAIKQAAGGETWDLGYPQPNTRTRGQALREDAAELARAVPDFAKAVGAAVKLARNNRDELTSSAGRSAPARARLDDDRLVTVPNMVAYIDEAQWHSRMESLGGTSNSLFAGIAAKLGQVYGRVDDNGRVRLQFPVSERTEGDTRANALTGMTVSIDPRNVTETLRDVRAELKKNLASLSESRFELLGPVALAPLIPPGLARRLEGMALGAGAPIGCSNLGKLDPLVSRPDGTDADHVILRQVESRITAEILDRLGGTLFCASGQVNGEVSLTVAAWRPGGPNRKDLLKESVRQVLDAFGLTATIE
jgi:diacylglycerol O-acyltransferase / wax synthase